MPRQFCTNSPFGSTSTGTGSNSLMASDMATTTKRRRQVRRSATTATGLALRQSDTPADGLSSPADRLSNEWFQLKYWSVQHLTSGGNQQHAEFTQCWQYRPDISFVDCLTANRNVATTLTQTLSQFHMASVITVDFNCRTLSDTNLGLNYIHVSRMQSKLILKFPFKNTRQRPRHDVAVFNTSPARASARHKTFRVHLYGAPQNTAGAVYTTRGLKTIKCTESGWNSRGDRHYNRFCNLSVTEHKAIAWHSGSKKFVQCLCRSP